MQIRIMEKSSDVAEPLTLENSGHALDNSVVLRQIFRELALSGSLQDLKKARLVTNSSNWQDELQKVWRQEAVLVLLGDEPEPLPALPISAGTTLYSYLAELDNPASPYQLAEVPYERIKLKNMAYIPMHPEIDKLYGSNKTFWDVVGPSMKHLTLKNAVVDMTSVQDPLFFLSARYPHLESLCLDGVTVQVNRAPWMEMEMTPPHGVPVTLEKVTRLDLSGGGVLGLRFSNLPNLVDLRLSGYHSLTFGSLLREQRDVAVIPGVKLLDLMNCEDFDDFHGPRVHFSELEHLKMKTDDHDETFIKMHSSTLKSLELRHNIIVAPFFLRPNPLDGTNFPVLTTLRMWGNVMNDLSFLRFTPNLQRLHWDLYGYEKRKEMREQIEKDRAIDPEEEDSLSLLNNNSVIGRVVSRHGLGVELAKLQHCHLNWMLNEQSVRALGEWMPNLKSFSAVLDSSSFREVCQRWDKLESLTCLFGSNITDQDIVPQENVSDLDLDKEAPQKCISPKGLTDLKGKDLKSFNFYPECNSSALSDACVSQGFLQMAQLRKLHVFVSDQFSEALERLLHEQIPEVKIYRHNSTEKLDCCWNMEYRNFIGLENLAEVWSE